MTQDLPVNRLQRFVRALAKDDSVGALLKVISSTNGEAFAFGGMPRDILFSGTSYFGDIDIFVSGSIDEDRLSSVSRVIGKTNFGGLRLLAGKYDVDIWELAKSKVFIDTKTLPISVPSLLSTVCFSTDAVSISFHSRRVIASRAFWRSLENREIDFVIPPKSLDPLQATRASRAIAKHDLTPSYRVARFIAEVVDNYGLSAILKAEERWRGKRYLDSISLGEVHDKVMVVVSTSNTASNIDCDPQKETHFASAF